MSKCAQFDTNVNVIKIAYLLITLHKLLLKSLLAVLIVRSKYYARQLSASAWLPVWPGLGVVSGDTHQLFIFVTVSLLSGSYLASDHSIRADNKP